MRERFYDHDVEVKKLGNKMKHWDNYFKMLGVKNYWFDTFNHHDYPDVSENMFDKDKNPRDLMSQMCEQRGAKFYNDKYHFSIWNRDCDRVKYMLEHQLVNKYSHHPNQAGHQMIADMFDKIF
tara:strand:- start:54 stop:422 length:369 start_codon:yes stop_codon:yes gene_type:complete